MKLNNVKDAHTFSALDRDESNLAVSISPDGKYFAATSTRGNVTIRPIEPKNATPATLNGGFGVVGRTASATAVKFADEPPTLEGYLCGATGSDGTVGLWRVSPGESISALSTCKEEGNEVMSLAFTPGTATKMATGGSDSIIRIYDVSATGLQLTRGIDQGISRHGQPEWGPPSKVMSIKFIDDNVFIAAGWETSALLYDLRVDPVEPVRVFAGSAVSGDGLDVKNNTVLTVSNRAHDQVQLFHLGTGAETHKFSVDFLALSGRLTLVKGLRPFVWLSGSSPGTVALLDTATGKMHARVDELEDAVFGLDVSPVDPLTVVAVGARDSVHRFTAQP